ncbi:MAG TPA: molecular chaperone DnaJ [Alphaproteobacteria bacterium]|nr:molecular chaperone DnaJ [Alphaproteobacteria bacterium]
MAKQDFYETLGVSRDVDADELKKAYRKMAMKYHPDRNPDDEAAEIKFKELSEAYSVLSDQQKREAYNRFGHAAFEGGGGPGAGDFDFRSSFSDVFDDLFGDFTGGSRRGARRGPARGADLRYNMEVSLEDAFSGKQAKVQASTSVNCDDCSGSGAKEGTKPTICGACNGVGKVRAQQGFFTIERTCPTCQGSGTVIADPCNRCRGSGRVQKDKTLSVNIPAGVEDGTRIRLAGEGEAGARGAPAGDLYIFISVKPHPLFQRDAMNLYCEVPIPMIEATLGGSIDVPTLGGNRARVTIPSGTQSGHQFRLRSKGMPALRGGSKGDMYIQVSVETPVNLNKKQKELLKQFDSLGTKSTNPQSDGFFSKVKDIWEDLKD